MSADPGSPAYAAPGADPRGPGLAAPDPAQPAAGGGPGTTDDGSLPEPAHGATDYAEVRDRLGGHRLEQEQQELARALGDLTRVSLRDNDIHGPVFLNSTFGLSFGQGDTRFQARKVTPEELSEPFVATDEIKRLAGSVGDEPIVVLQGPRGHGKSSALLHTLRDQAPGGVPVFYLAPSTDLGTFACNDDVPAGAVLIVADLPDSAVGRLDDYTARRIASELRARGCRLGITTGRQARLAVSSPGVVTAELATRPEPAQVFRLHLAEALLGTGISRPDVLSWPGVSALVDSQLGPDCTLADAQRLAMLLSRAAGTPLAAADTVRAQMNEYADESVAQWYRNLPSQQAHCTALSLAVLNGLSREVITHEARVLDQLISPAPDAPNAPAARNPFAAAAAVSPATLAATVIAHTQDRDEGPVVVAMMSYREPGYPGRVLRHVWREQDEARPYVVQWLGRLGRSPDLRIRVRAATAVGVLACESLDYLYNAVILPWALAKTAEVRDSAAIALGPAAAEPRLRNTVRELVAGWAVEDASWQLRATAARAYGRAIGLSTPTPALRALARLAEESGGDLEILGAIGNSYCELVLNGTTALSVRVIGEAAQLAADRKRPLQAAGRLTLLALSMLRGPAQDMEGAGSRLSFWPTLLLLALANNALAESAARLWQLALPDPDLGDLIALSLDGWAQEAEKSSELRGRFVDFLYWIAADPRARQLVVRRAQHWSGRSGRAPKTGRYVIEGRP